LDPLLRPADVPTLVGNLATNTQEGGSVIHPPFDTRALFKAINEWASAKQGRGFRAAGGNGGYSFIQLHTRPDPRGPEKQLTFRAAIVDGHAVIQIPELEPSRSDDTTPETRSDGASVASFVGTIDTESLGRDPDAVCEGCGVVGTVGRAVRTSADDQHREVHNFCAKCWPEQSARYRARWKEEDRLWREEFHRGRTKARGAGPGMGFISATWHGILEMIDKIEATMVAPAPPTKEALAAIAADIERHAAEREGEMPYRVEAFIRRHGMRRDTP
jgi:hypothetical protein